MLLKHHNNNNIIDQYLNISRYTCLFIIIHVAKSSTLIFELGLELRPTCNLCRTVLTTPTCHTPLQPSNILLDEVGHIRLSDLGLACEFKDREPSSSV